MGRAGGRFDRVFFSLASLLRHFPNRVARRRGNGASGSRAANAPTNSRQDCDDRREQIRREDQRRELQRLCEHDVADEAKNRLDRRLRYAAGRDVAINRISLRSSSPWLFTAVLAALTAGCGGGQSGSSIPGSGAPGSPPPRTSAITHVVIIVPRKTARSTIFFKGYPGADSAKSGMNSKGQSVPLIPEPLTADYDISHSHTSFLTEYCKRQVKRIRSRTFALSLAQGGSALCVKRELRAYAYVPRGDIAEYWEMARANVLADRMFESNQGPSFPAHQYLLSGTSTIQNGSNLRASEEPRGPSGRFTGGCDSPAGSLGTVIDQYGNEDKSVFPCFDRTSLLAFANGDSGGADAVLAGAPGRRRRDPAHPPQRFI